MEMENLLSSELSNQNISNIDNLKKKRPDSVRLDIQKMFQESVQLTQIHRKLVNENKKLHKEYRKVEEARTQRQQFISNVEKIVKEKSQELTSKNSNQPSWLVFKLHKKIYDLKNQINQKDKAIKKLKLSKQNQILYRKEVQLQCLNEIACFANKTLGKDFEKRGFSQDQQNSSRIKDIVWMEDYLKGQQQKLEELQQQLQQEQRQTKKIMMKLATKKNQLKRMKQASKQYFTAQQNYKHQKKKKQQKIVGNKGYLSSLMKQRDNQLQNLEKLKLKQKTIEQQQKKEIEKLKNKLEQLKILYQDNKIQMQQTKQPILKSLETQRKQEWVKRVTLQQVETIARNINFTLRLRKITQKQWVAKFFNDGAQTYSISEIINKFAQQPFCWESYKQRKLIARYTVQDNDQGFMLQDLNTSQNSPIIKSILMKLIGDIKVYSQQTIQFEKQKIGDKLFKFSSLVQQAIQMKEGNITRLSQQKLIQGVQAAELELDSEEIQFVVLFLFSWSKDIESLDLKKLGKLKSIGFNNDI